MTFGLEGDTLISLGGALGANARCSAAEF